MLPVPKYGALRIQARDVDGNRVAIRAGYPADTEFSLCQCIAAARTGKPLSANNRENGSYIFISRTDFSVSLGIAIDCISVEYELGLPANITNWHDDNHT